MDIKKLIALPIAEYISCNTEFVMGLVEVPKNSMHGDYSLPCFKLFEFMSSPPNDIAENIKENVKFWGFINIVNCGPYLNFYIDKSLFASNAVYEILSHMDNYFKWDTATVKGTVLLCSNNLWINTNPFQKMVDSKLNNTMHGLLSLKGFQCLKESELDIIINDSERREMIEEISKKAKLIDFFDYKAVFFSEETIPPCLIVKHGLPTAIVDNLIMIIRCCERYKVIKIIYIINQESTTVYNQLKELLSLLDYNYSEMLSMVSYEQSKFYDVQCHIIINQNSHIQDLISIISSKLQMELDKIGVRLKHISEGVEKLTSGALSSLYFSSIKRDKETCIIDRLISLEGEGLPYVQYTYAKAYKILADSFEVPLEFIKRNNSLFEHEEAYKLGFMLSEFVTVMEEAAKELRPDLIASFCVNVAVACESFLKSFDKYPLTTCDIRKAGICLLKAFIKVIEEALRILGVEVVEIM